TILFFLKKTFGLLFYLYRIKITILNTEIDELELINGLGRNDRKSIELLYEMNYPAIQSFILNNNGSIDDARDIFQESVIVLYEKVAAGNFQLQSKIKTFLYAVARRIWLKKLQQMQRFGNIVEDAEDLIPVEEDIEEQERKNEAFNQMDKALSHLGEPCKSLLEAFYIQKRPMHEIAEIFGYTNADNAKNQKYKCLIRLKKLFFKQHKSE
ncbi:MAG: RNA polymerase sigma factor, partial [Bacteroidota bacterium]